MENRPVLYLADDHTDFCEVAMAHLRADFAVAGFTHDPRTVAADVARTRPDLVVIDMSMRLVDASDVATSIREHAPCARSLFVAHSVDAVTSTPLSLGPLGFFVRIARSSEIPAAVWSLLGDRDWEEEEDAQSTHLTRREREVVQLLAEGKLMKQVADMLNMSPRTVAFHKYGVMRKLGLHSSAELVRMAVSEGLIA